MFFGGGRLFSYSEHIVLAGNLARLCISYGREEMLDLGMMFEMIGFNTDTAQMLENPVITGKSKGL